MNNETTDEPTTISTPLPVSLEKEELLLWHHHYFQEVQEVFELKEFYNTNTNQWS